MGCLGHIRCGEVAPRTPKARKVLLPDLAQCHARREQCDPLGRVLRLPYYRAPVDENRAGEAGSFYESSSPRPSERA